MNDRPSANLGERIAGLEAKFDGFERYTHDKWHDLNNVLQPLGVMPERITRDIAKMEGKFDGRMDTFRKDIEQTITKALEPVNDEIAWCKQEIETLKEHRWEMTGGRMLAVWFIQTLIAAASAVFAVLSIRGSH